MRRSARLNLLRSAFSNWWVAGYLGSFAYRFSAVSPSLTRRLLNIRLRLRTRDGRYGQKLRETQRRHHPEGSRH